MSPAHVTRTRPYPVLCREKHPLARVRRSAVKVGNGSANPDGLDGPDQKLRGQEQGDCQEPKHAAQILNKTGETQTETLGLGRHLGLGLVPVPSETAQRHEQRTGSEVNLRLRQRRAVICRQVAFQVPLQRPRQTQDCSSTMSVVALFRGKWGQKTQDTSEKHPAASVQPSHEEDEDEDESKGGFSREPIRRNSRFYRSMRKKRLAASEQPKVCPDLMSTTVHLHIDPTNHLCCPGPDAFTSAPSFQSCVARQ
ncbi:hypothetical protein INR49_020489 [Caranx melampygus]|nr:hypothetical protein INR49_020489 [Caranx melampygus]